MRKACLYLLFALGWLSLKAQPFPTNQSRSPFTYIYKISGKEAKRLYFSEMEAADITLLHTLIDSFRFTTDPPHLQLGNYLLAHVDKNNWSFELYTVDDLAIYSFNQRRGAIVVLKNKMGQPITDASVHFGAQKVRYDDLQGGYVYRGSRQRVKLSILHQQVYHFATLFDGYEDDYYDQTFFEKLGNSRLVRKVRKPFEKLVQKWQGNHTRRIISYPGFLTYNKPLYRKGDSLHWKAFVTNLKIKPINKPLELRLIHNRYPVMDSLVAMVYPYRPGMFSGSFRLSDSLIYDQPYTLQLRDPSSRQVYLRSNFLLEDYSLSRMNFSMKLDREELSPWKSGTITLTLNDENELPIADGQLTLSIVTNRVSAESDREGFFLKDTLWQLQRAADPNGVTTITLPDSLFPKAHYDFSILGTVRTVSGEYRTTSVNGKYNNDSTWISFEPEDDSVLVTQWKNNKIDSTIATLTYFDTDYDTLMVYEGRLPMRIPLHTAAETLEAETEDAYEEWEPNPADPSIQCLGNRTKDSVWIQARHPLGIPFWYRIYKNKKIVEKGMGRSLNWKAAAKEKELYLIDIDYLLGGQSHHNSYNLPFAENELKIFAEHPVRIEPGQEVGFTLNVRDAHDQPVEGADITAYAFTKKFSRSKLPDFRNYSRKYKFRRQITHYNREEDLDRSGAIPFDPASWMNKLGLDTMNFFKFIYPDPYLRLLQLSADSITQIAPFLLEKGKFIEVIQLDIDQEPVYMAGATDDKTYSFRVSPGFHTLRFRTMNAAVVIDSVEVINGMKNSFSFNYNAVWNKMSLNAMPDSFTVNELALWRQALIQIRYTPQQELVYFEQKGRLFASPQITQENYYLSGTLQDIYGPLNNDTLFVHTDSNRRAMAPKAGYTLHVLSDTIKEIKQPLSSPFRLRAQNRSFGTNPPLGDRVLTDAMLRKHWENLIEKRALQIASNIYESNTGNSKGSLRINENYTLSQKNLGVKLYLLLKTNEPDFLRIKSSGTLIFHDLEAGYYRLLVLYGNYNYVYSDSIRVQNAGISFTSIREKDLKAVDSFIISLRGKIMRGLIDRNYNRSNTSNYDQAKQLINKTLTVPESYRYTVGGRVVSAMDGSPIPFCSIVIRGTSFGTTTDANGFFQLNCPEIAVLVFSAVGFEMAERPVNDSAELLVQIAPSKNNLQEVVVTALGISSTKKELGFSVAKIEGGEMLMGKVAGVQVTLQGISSIKVDNKIKIYVNGMPFEGSLQEIDSTLIETITVIKADKARSLYGTDGLTDVIDVRLKLEQPRTQIKTTLPSDKKNSLRSNFRDDAYWLPHLITDARGQVQFNIRFPDDITSWRNQFVALTPKGQFGTKETFINAQRSLSAAVLLPRFLIDGDQVKILGRAQYYGKDSISISRTLQWGSINNIAEGYIKNILFDSIDVRANGTDSITALYEIQQGKGAYDGERRTIPVFKKGVAEDSGFFVTLRKDSNFRAAFPRGKGPLIIRADKSLLPVMLDEIDQLERYEYLCNEQLASKIMALLLKEKIYKIQQTEFKDQKTIRSLTRKLQSAANKQGLWGWWSDATLSPWISKHVIDALTMARESGYGKEINFSRLTAVLRYELALQTGSDRIWYVEMLQKIGNAKLEDSLLRIDHFEQLPLEEKIRWAHAQLHNGQKPDLGFLWKYRLETTKGNPYWSTQNNTVWNNDLLLSASVYALLKTAGGYENELQALRYYFLEQRTSGSWRNTYESAKVLETILPDLMQDAADGPAKLFIDNKEVKEFPHQSSINESGAVEVRYTGKQPLYFTAYQRNWNPVPEKISGAFTVKTYFSENGNAVNTLTKGKPVDLKVQVDISRQTDYVMIEIPIPAGCSIEQKKAGGYKEVYREYNKDRVLIYYEKLPRGRIDLDISLLPQFTGTFSMNPARAMEMYYPVQFGREQLKRVSIVE